MKIFMEVSVCQAGIAQFGDDGEQQGGRRLPIGLDGDLVRSISSLPASLLRTPSDHNRSWTERDHHTVGTGDDLHWGGRRACSLLVAGR